jgi:hypothetical protein
MMDKKWKTFFVLWIIGNGAAFGFLSQHVADAPRVGTAAKAQRAAGESLAVCSDTRVRVRSSPNLDSSTLGFLDLGDKLKVLETSARQAKIGDATANFFRIRREGDGLEGWAFGSYLIMRSTTWLNRAWPSLPRAYRLKVTKVNAGEVLNIRASPGTDSPIVGDIPPDGTDIAYRESSQSRGDEIWLKIAYGNYEGWVNSRYVERQ